MNNQIYHKKTGLTGTELLPERLIIFSAIKILQTGLQSFNLVPAFLLVSLIDYEENDCKQKG